VGGNNGGCLRGVRGKAGGCSGEGGYEGSGGGKERRGEGGGGRGGEKRGGKRVDEKGLMGRVEDIGKRVVSGWKRCRK